MLIPSFQKPGSDHSSSASSMAAGSAALDAAPTGEYSGSGHKPYFLLLCTTDDVRTKLNLFGVLMTTMAG